MKAIADFTQALELTAPEDSFSALIYHNNRGASYRELGEYSKAIGELGKAISVEANSMPYLNRGLTHQRIAVID